MWSCELNTSDSRQG